MTDVEQKQRRMETAPWIEYTPPSIPHVKAQYKARTFDPATGLPDGQEFKVECGVCHQRWGGVCMSGNPRVSVVKFAVQHVHRDPLAAPRVVSPASRRAPR